MSKLVVVFLLLLVSSCHLLAQSYSGFGYANGETNSRYQMPGTKITNESEDELNTNGVVTGYCFDTKLESGPNFSTDKDETFGVYTNGNATDGGGMDKRGYSTSSAPEYAPIRWNGGSQMFRQGGQWVRYSIDFVKGSFNFVYRGNIKSYAISKHKFDLNIYHTSNMAVPLFQKTIDLTTDFPEEGATSKNIARLGGGNDDTDWFKDLDQIVIEEAGTYVVELDAKYFTYTFAPWGAFTFNEIEKYNGKAYNNGNWNPRADTVKVWQYDKVDKGKLFEGGEKNITVGVHNNESTEGGENIRAYSDCDLPDAILWNSDRNTFKQTGAWFNYSFDFPGREPYFFTFKGIPIIENEEWRMNVQFIEANTNFVYEEITLDDGIEFVNSSDEGLEKRWMYINKPVIIPKGTYIVKVDFPKAGYDGFMECFAFCNEHPQNNIQQIITYNWASTIPKSDKYGVKVFQNDQEYELFPHLSEPDTRASLYPEDNGSNGVMSVLEDRTFTFTQFSFTDEIIVEVEKKFGTEADRVEIQPKAYGINPFYFDGKKVKFRLRHQPNRPSYISVNFVCADNLDKQAIDDHIVPKHGMVLFADKPEVHVPSKSAEGLVIYGDDVSAQEVQNANIICCNWSDLMNTSTNLPPISRMASSAGWKLPARWRPTRSFCSWMNPLRA